MPIDVTRALETEPLVHDFTWGPAEAQRYNIGLGAGCARDGADDLAYLADDPAVPKGGTGKVLKSDLRAPHWSGHTRHVN